MVRPRASRSARATPSNHVRSSVTERVSFRSLAPKGQGRVGGILAGADCTLAPVRVLVAPDKFKGTLSAPEAAEAIAAGIRRALPGADVEVAPMADGGEGTLDALLAAM